MTFLLLPVILVAYSYSFRVGCDLDLNNIHFATFPTDLSLAHGFINVDLLHGATAYSNGKLFILAKAVGPCKRDLGLPSEYLEFTTMNEIFRAGEILRKCRHHGLILHLGYFDGIIGFV